MCQIDLFIWKTEEAEVIVYPIARSRYWLLTTRIARKCDV